MLVNVTLIYGLCVALCCIKIMEAATEGKMTLVKLTLTPFVA